MPIEFLKIIGVGIVTLISYIVIKPLKPDIAIFVSLAGGCIILLMCIDGMEEIISTISNFISTAGIDSSLFSLILKLIGIGYLTEFACNLCIESGNSSLADKISLGGRLCILLMGLPIISNLLNLITGLVP